MIPNDTIIALATPPGSGAIAVIRISGKKAIPLVSTHFGSVRGKDLSKQKSHTIHLGHLKDKEYLLDEVLVSIFKGPHSYTGEDVVEISCHGSPFIQQQIIQLFLRKGCRMAEAGEFTLRAFLNAKMDLSQAEAVADLIASENAASHEIAIKQMRGGFSSEIKRLRGELLNFASLIELELDFAEEDVEFANRGQFKDLLKEIRTLLKQLIDSFALGNVIKNGIPVAIVGEPNVGKSTLLNALLKEERAIVSEIPGTTRDTIEDEISIGGVGFRFIDTAGIRQTQDSIEEMGIQRTFQKMEQAQLVVYLVDGIGLIAMGDLEENLYMVQQEIIKLQRNYPDKRLLTVINKIDQLNGQEQLVIQNTHKDVLLLSAKMGEGVEELKAKLLELIDNGVLRNKGTVVSNTRHDDALLKALKEVEKVQRGINEEVPGDLLSIDIKQALNHLGEITGEITSDELLGNIFANFCIGK
ncbi:MAG: tRNA uridine-5-carboxymethylaminomethyl(34) synthesis GTPase MnmE [Flavobacteriales bacterium]|nr:MAG: tRNA uridine-5-carboxymethylaminomethyl(34) synthesis GTPase MnmE [Flavobacteriales bacterium]